MQHFLLLISLFAIFNFTGRGTKDIDKKAKEAELREPQVRVGATLQRQGDDRVRARHRTQPAGAQHRARPRRQVLGAAHCTLHSSHFPLPIAHSPLPTSH